MFFGQNNKTQIAVLTVICIFSFLLQLESADFPFVGRINADNVNLRSGYNKNFSSLKKLRKDEKVIVLDKKTNWYKIKLPSDVYCFVHQKYVSREGRILTDNLNVRAGPSPNFHALTQLNKGVRVNIQQKVKDWYRISPPDKAAGWVFKDYVDYLSIYKNYASKKKNTDRQAHFEKIAFLSRYDLDNLDKYSKEVLLDMLTALESYKKKYEATLSTDTSSKLQEKMKKISAVLSSREKTKNKKQKKPTYPFVSEGLIYDLGNLIGNPASYKLITENNHKYYLVSKNIKLENYTGRQVCIRGHRIPEKFANPLIEVEKISFIK
jgi:uncharacterized protein YgiM (DUF1202 family)